MHEAERDYSAVRQAELVNQGVTGDFSFKHLCSIHKYLFGDVYSWAGEIRTVDISKGTFFCLVQFIESHHPFREGNGRTQRIYIEQLCSNNGRFEIDFTDVSKEEMIAASVRSANIGNDMLEKLIRSCLVERLTTDL